MLPLGSRETIVEIGMTRNLVFREEKKFKRDEGGYNVVTFFFQFSENASAMVNM